jgi:hypothetical protein
MAVVDGVGPDAPIKTNEQGGQQSDLPYRLDLMPPFALLEVGRILAHGARKYAPWNWLKIDTNSHINHALVHLTAYLCGDDSEGKPIEHLKHAACRVMMALEVALREEKANS